MQQAIQAAQVDEHTKICDILDPPFQDLTHFQLGDQALAFFHHIRFQQLLARQHNVFAGFVQLDDLEFKLATDKLVKILHRPDIDLGAWQKGRYPTQVHDHAPLYPSGNTAQNRLSINGFLGNIRPVAHKVSLFLGEHCLSVGVLQPHQVDHDFIPDLRYFLVTEFVPRYDSLRLETDVHQDFPLVHPNHPSGDNLILTYIAHGG